MSDRLYKKQLDYSEIPDGAVILDVRSAGEHAQIALRRKHYFIELPRFDAAAFIKDYGLKGEQVCVLCKSGVRASKAAEKLEKAGYSNVCIIKGGIASLYGRTDAVYENRAISLERQVRIAAGALVVLGSLPAIFWNPWCALLPAFVGCGLIYAGISDTCAMASLLAKLPWNK